MIDLYTCSAGRKENLNVKPKDNFTGSRLLRQHFVVDTVQLKIVQNVTLV